MIDSDWISMKKYEDIMYHSVKGCMHDEGFSEIHKQLEQTRDLLIRNVKDFDVVIKNVEAFIVGRRKELAEPKKDVPQRWHMRDGAYIIIRGRGT